MSTILLYISLFLHVFTISWLLSLRQKQANEAEQMQRIKEDIEQTLITYTTEMKTENERLVEMVQQTYTVQNEQKTTVQKDEKETEEKLKISEVENEYEAYDPLKITELTENDQFTQSTEAQVFALEKQGYTVEQIAKQLNIGVGEVQLMLKLHH